ncbi:MAG TPA: alkaline phosphatase D family protein, partial [Acidimicrobiales bacterium]|nr:alkaline phosphatase D family protein [Acidimicrobiales bacterium]
MPRNPTRREFLATAAGAAVIVVAPSFGHRATASTLPFLHGVASGDPLSDRVVIWTRLTPTADAVPGSGRGAPVTVTWQVARDEAFTDVIAHGTTVADARSDHTVQVDVTGLDADAYHWYRFTALGATSPVGRTRTTAAPTTTLDSLRLGIVTCAEFEFGRFGVYRLLAERDDIDAVIHLGDYVYEFGRSYGPLSSPGERLGRRHEPPHECLTLSDYRMRYGQHRRDSELQAMHAAHPVIAMYDDHEVANDTWREGAENHSAEEGSFANRARAGHQAWREWLPLRLPDPAAPEKVERTFQFGNLAQLWMLDERRYRDEPPASAVVGYGSVDPAIDDPSRTMLGAPQREWLTNGLRTSAATWKVLGNPV